MALFVVRVPNVLRHIARIRYITTTHPDQSTFVPRSVTSDRYTLVHFNCLGRPKVHSSHATVAPFKWIATHHPLPHTSSIHYGLESAVVALGIRSGTQERSARGRGLVLILLARLQTLIANARFSATVDRRINPFNTPILVPVCDRLRHCLPYQDFLPALVSSYRNRCCIDWVASEPKALLLVMSDRVNPIQGQSDHLRKRGRC